LTAVLEPTPSQTAGPFFAIGLTTRVANELVAADDPRALAIAGTVLDGGGRPIPDAMVEIWAPDVGWGRCGTDETGSYSFRAAKPAAPDGQAPHLDVLVFARGLVKPVLTRLYFPDEAEANAGDPVLAALPEEARATLVGAADGAGVRFDVRLQGEGQTTFFAL
jgi:protocatechuate 3,4-dioxygenase alpha subunit